jgi:hypothetical protein
MMAGGGFNISIATLSGNNLELSDVRADTTISNIKEMLVGPTGVTPDQQRLIFKGMQLSDGFPLSVYGITSGSTLFLVLRIRGGMHHQSSSAVAHSSSPQLPIQPPSLIDIQRMADSVKSGREIFGMGFDTDKVLKALNTSDNDQSRAIELLLSEAASPIASPGNDREIFKMGLDPRLVTAALAQTNNDEQMAIALIFEGFH